MDVDNKFFNAAFLLVATLVVAKLISALIIPRSKKRLPPTIKAFPLIGGLIRFLKGPVVMLREEYPKLGSVFTLKLLNKNISFFVGPDVSAHFFKAPESDLSQQEVYRFNVPIFGPGVVFDVDYSVRQEQFRFFTEALRVTKLKGYVDQMVMEAEVSVFWLNMSISWFRITFCSESTLCIFACPIRSSFIYWRLLFVRKSERSNFFRNVTFSSFFFPWKMTFFTKSSLVPSQMILFYFYFKIINKPFITYDF